MKRWMFISLLWLSILSFPVQAEDISLTYKIYYDSESENLVDIKNQVIKQVQTYFDYVDMNSTIVLLSKDISYLESDLWEVDFKNPCISFYIGDGKGVMIHGSFLKNIYCIKDVKPKSLILELLGLD